MTTRFVIISSPRCGTHLVGTALSSREGVGSCFEPFSSNAWKGGLVTSRVWREIWSPEREKKHFLANGFILHRTQGGLSAPKDSPDYANSVWKKLQAAPDIKIVQITRRSWLKRYVSHTIATRTRVWQQYKEQSQAQFMLKVRLPELGVFIDTHMALERMSDDCLQQHALTYHVYEDIVTNPQASFDAIQTFLGLDKQELTPTTKKQEGRPLSQVITNYAEVVKFLRGEFDLVEKDTLEGEV